MAAQVILDTNIGTVIPLENGNICTLQAYSEITGVVVDGADLSSRVVFDSEGGETILLSSAILVDVEKVARKLEITLETATNRLLDGNKEALEMAARLGKPYPSN